MEINVISKVDIVVTQEDLESMIRESVAASNSSINIHSIEFIQRRSPNRIDVEIDASIGNQQTSSTALPTKRATLEEKAEEQLELPEPEIDFDADAFVDSSEEDDEVFE